MRTLGKFAACAIAGVGSVASAQFTFNVVVLETDNVAGVGNVTQINNLAVNDNGDWLVEADTDNADTDFDVVILDANGVVFQEGTGIATPAGTVIDFFDSIVINSAGNIGQNLFIDPFASDMDSGIYWNEQILIQEGDISTSPDLSAGTPYVGFFSTKLNDAEDLVVVASVDDPAIASSVDRALVVLETDGAGNLTTETVIVKEGDVLPGMAGPVEDFETSTYEFAFTDDGDLYFFAEIGTGGTADDTSAWHWDGANFNLLAQEGAPSPFAGRTYGSLTGAIDSNDNGDYVLKTNLENGDDAIIINGAGFIKEGDTLPAISPFVFDNLDLFAPIHIDNNLNVLWYAEWDDANADIDSGLFYNETLLIQEGVTQFLGLTVDTIQSTEDTYILSDNGRWAMVEVWLEGGIQAAVLIEIEVAACPNDPAGTACDTDITGDCVVNNQDLGVLLAAYLASSGDASYNDDVDFVDDDTIDNQDLGALLADYLNNCN